MLKKTQAPIRKHPSSYIGPTNSEGIQNLIWATVSLSVNQAISKFCTYIDIVINADNSFLVKSDVSLSLIPPEESDDSGTLQLLMTEDFNIRRFYEDVYGFRDFGVDTQQMNIVNTLSKWAWVEIIKEGQIYRQEYKQGQLVTTMQLNKLSSDNCTTIFCFKPDPRIFKPDYIDFSELEYFMRKVAYLTHNLRITILDTRTQPHLEVIWCIV